MMGEWVSTLRSLCHSHRLLASILILEYALTFAIVTSAASIVLARAHAFSIDSGLVEDGLYVVRASGITRTIHRSDWYAARSTLQTATGRANVALASAVPFEGTHGASIPLRQPGHAGMVRAEAYFVGQRAAAVMGLRLLRGRLFRPDEVVTRTGEQAHVALISASLGRRLFGTVDVVGKQVLAVKNALTIVGVYADLAAPQYLGDRQTGYTILVPALQTSHLKGGLLLVRDSNGAASVDKAVASLQKRDQGQINWFCQPYREIRLNYFHADHVKVRVLVAVMLGVFFTALCGLLGLTTYWIGARRAQVAIRRALGATRHQVMLHFFVESGLLVGVGLLIGLLAALLTGEHASLPQAGLTPYSVLLGLLVTALLAVTVVSLSLKRLLRLPPIELMRRR